MPVSSSSSEIVYVSCFSWESLVIFGKQDFCICLVSFVCWYFQEQLWFCRVFGIFFIIKIGTNSHKSNTIMCGLKWLSTCVRGLWKWKVKVKSLSHVTLCNPMDCSLPGSSIHGIFQARILERVVISFSWRSSRPRHWTQASHIVGRRFTISTTRKSNTVNIP